LGDLNRSNELLKLEANPTQTLYVDELINDIKVMAKANEVMAGG